MMRVLLLLCLFAVLMSGCAKPGMVGSFCGPLPKHSAVSAIAADAVASLSTLYPPGHTSLRLLPARDADNDFAAAFENGLRAKGFTLAAAGSDDAITVAYILDALEDANEKSAWYLQLRLSDPKSNGKAIARAYTADGLPEAGQSRTELEFRSSPVGNTAERVRRDRDAGVEVLAE